MDSLVVYKPDVLLLHARTNHVQKNINPLNNLSKIHQKCRELSPETKLVFRKSKQSLRQTQEGINN